MKNVLLIDIMNKKLRDIEKSEMPKQYIGFNLELYTKVNKFPVKIEFTKNRLHKRWEMISLLLLSNKFNL